MKALFSDIVAKTHPKCFGLAANFYNTAIPRSEQAVPKEPIVFAKSLDSISFNQPKIKIDSQGTNHEVEMGVLIGKKGKFINKNEALDYIGGYFLCLDLTSSFIVRKGGLSFCTAKSRDNYLPVSQFIDLSEISDPNDVDLLLEINGETRAKGNTRDMIFNVQDQIEYLSKFMTLNVGDMILTGTPLPIAQIFNGDKLHAELAFKDKLLAKIDVEIEHE